MRRKRKKTNELRNKISFFALLVFDGLFLIFLIWQIGRISWAETRKFFVSVAAKEEMEHKNGIREHVEIIENQLSSLEERLADMQNKDEIISLDEKVDLQNKLEELEKEAQRIEIEFYHHQSDFSLEINPFRDGSIDNLFNKIWNLPLKINRFIRSYEAMVFRGYLAKDQAKLIQKNLNSVRWQIGEIRNAL